MLLQASAKGLSSSPWSVRRCATVLGTRAAYAKTNWEDGQAAHDHPAEAFEATLINAICCQRGAAPLFSAGKITHTPGRSTISIRRYRRGWATTPAAVRQVPFCGLKASRP
jgi:hypothetical protein